MIHLPLFVKRRLIEHARRFLEQRRATLEQTRAGRNWLRHIEREIERFENEPPTVASVAAFALWLHSVLANVFGVKFGK